MPQEVLHHTIDLVLTLICLATIVHSSSPLHPAASVLHQAPDECRWTMVDDQPDLTLVCRLRTINSELENTNFSVIQPQNTIRLRLECNEALFFQSSISEGSFRPLVELRSLAIHYCKIGNLTAGALQGLRELRNLTIRTHNTDWSTMQLQLADNVFTDELKLLERLDLSENNIWAVPDGMLCPLTSLRYLNLTHNRIHDLIGFHFSASPSTRSSKMCGSSIYQLDLTANSMDNLPPAIFSGLGQLTHLQLGNNKMNFIADRALEGLLALAHLNLSNNRISSLPPELFNEARNVREIYLQNNTIDVLAPGLFNELSQLMVLDLSHNRLSSDWINLGTFRKLRNLIYLDISHNFLERLEVGVFQDNRLLEVIRLNQNRIESIGKSLNGLANLHTLVLSNNALKTMSSNLLIGMENLAMLSLDYNQISSVDVDSLRNCAKLQDLHLNGNLLKLTPTSLEIVPFIKTLDLGENQLVDIANASFRDMRQLFGLRLTENQIEVIGAKVFQSMTALHILNLSRNRIRHIERGAFDGNIHLQAIRLDGNALHDIVGLFEGLPNLVWLNMSDNRMDAFNYATLPTGLKWLDVHSNRITELGNYLEIEKQLTLSTLDIGSNRLTEITGNVIPDSVEVLSLNDNLISKVQAYSFFKKPNITRVDLFGNRITTLDPNALRISAVPSDRPLPEFYIGGNPFQCDCNLDWLQKNQTDVRTQPILMDVASIYCKLLYNRGKVFVPLVEAMANQFLCQYDAHCPTLCHCCDFFACDCKMECPTGCTCYHDQSWSSNVVDCSRANYLDRLPDQIPMDATQIYLDGNRFRTVNNHAFIGRKKLRILFLNSSSIETVQNRTFNGLIGLRLLHLGNNRLRRLRGHEFYGCPSLRELYLQQNQITVIANDTFRALSQLRQLRLDGNRLVQFAGNGWGMSVESLIDVRLSENAWSCDCDNVDGMLEFLQHLDFVKDSPKIRCVLDGNPTHSGFALLRNESKACGDYVALINTNSSNELTTQMVVGSKFFANLVPNGLWPWILGSAITVFILLILGCLMIVFLQELRVWLHSQFGIRWFCGRHEVDDFQEREKLFDAFVSYSSNDEAFVAEQLAPVLESGESPYTLCLHYRDFPVGGVIAETIVQAIESSRRTIMVLSENYIKSEWCRFEFKSAHHRVLRDRKRRLIVIVLGQVPDSLDADIRSYLKTNTYLQWGDRYFWDKLRYALPDVKNEGRLAGCTTPADRGVVNIAAPQVPLMPTEGSLAAAAAVLALSRPGNRRMHPIAAPRGSLRGGYHGPIGGVGGEGHIPMAQLRMSGRMPSAPPTSFNINNMYS